MEKRVKDKKSVLIIVHGLWKKRLGIRWLDKLIDFFAKELTAGRSIARRDYHEFADFITADYDKIELFRWDGKIYPKLDSIPESERLECLLEKYKNYTIDILAVSLGGLIVEKTLKYSPIRINKLIYVGAVHKAYSPLKNVDLIINIYSTIDKMFYFANDVYEGAGNFLLMGENVMNIALRTLKHDELLINKKLDGEAVKEPSLYDFYRHVLKRKNAEMRLSGIK